MLTPNQIAEAWHSIQDEWFVRRNKAHRDGLQWEVCHWTGRTLIVLTRRGDRLEAEAVAGAVEDEARGAAVLKLIETMK